MPTLQKGRHPGQRKDAGNAILDATKVVDVRPVKRRVDAFAKAHRAWLAADDLVRKAEEALRARQALIGELDATQDELAELLAKALVGDGLPRANPLKALGFAAVSAIVKMASREEARTLVKLARKASARAGASKQVQDLSRQVIQTAEAVLAAWEPVADLEKAVTAAMVRRNAVSPAWEKAFVALKRAALAAADDGHEGLYEALFVSTAKAPVKAKAKAVSGGPAGRKRGRTGGGSKGEPQGAGAEGNKGATGGGP